MNIRMNRVFVADIVDLHAGKTAIHGPCVKQIRVEITHVL